MNRYCGWKKSHSTEMIMIPEKIGPLVQNKFCLVDNHGLESNRWDQVYFLIEGESLGTYLCLSLRLSFHINTMEIIRNNNGFYIIYVEQCLVHIWFSMVVVNVFHLFNKCLLCCFYILILFWIFQTEQFLHSRTKQLNKRDNLMVMSFKPAGPILVSPRSYIFLHNLALFNRRLYPELILIQSESVSLWCWRIWNFDIKKDKLVSENYLSGGQAYLEITNIMGETC